MLKMQSVENIGSLQVGRINGGTFAILDTRTNSQRTGYSSRKVAIECARKQIVSERSRAVAEGRVCLRCGRIHKTPEAAQACTHQSAPKPVEVKAEAPQAHPATLEAMLAIGRQRLESDYQNQIAQSRKLYC